MTPPSHQIELILRQVDALPTLSTVATRLLQVAGVEDADLDALVEIIESDPALTARLLGLCRRADKGLGDRITTVRRAVVMLGLEAVQAAALSVAVYDAMSTVGPRDLESKIAAGSVRPSATPSLNFDRPGFWRFSIAVATASEIIAEAHPDRGVVAAEAFVAGLLHGIGKLSLDLILPRTYGRILGLAERRQGAAAQAEMELLGVDHHTAGKRLGEHWSLPTALRDVMWLYAQPASALPNIQHKPLIGVVSAARTLCRHLHLGWSGDFNHPEPLDGPRGVCAPLGLKAELVEGIVPRLHEGFLRRVKVLGLGEQSTPELLMRSIAGANERLGRMTSMLQQRARGAQRQARILGAIRDFHASIGAIRPSPGVEETLGEVARSASSVLGEGFYGAVVQTRESEPWQLVVFDGDGQVTRSQTIEAPGPRGGGGCASLAALCNQSAMSLGALGSVPWFTDELIDAPDLRKIQILPLSTGAEGGACWPAAILLHDRDLSGGAWSDRALMSALTSTWATAIASASYHDGARRLGETLAAQGRALADAQARLAETQSLARLGEMASGAAHEMNNPLTVISGRAQILAAGVTKANERSAAEAIVSASRHLTDLITSMRLLADPPVPQAVPVPLDALIQAAIARAAERLGTVPAAGLVQRCSLQLPPSAPFVRLDRELIAAALAEVIANAVQASTSEPVAIRAETDASDSRLLIVIEDRGTGMSAKALQHAFDPFFSDLPAGRRTGLGLTRARRLVELHGGEIALASRPGHGTTATISLPGVLEPTTTPAPLPTATTAG